MVMVTVTANSRNSRPTMPPISSSGMNTATSEMLMERIVKPISPAPLSAASSGDRPVLDVAVDVLEHDDRVIDHEADGDGQGHQRQVVEAVAEHVHQRRGAQQRQRHGDARDRSVAQKLRRNRKITITTSTIVSISVNSTSFTEAWMVVVRSIDLVDLDATGAPRS